MANIFTSLIGRLVFETQKGVPDLRLELEASSSKLSTQFLNVEDTDQNRRLLSHIIGIERWGQRRIRVALGEAFVMEEYDGYRPPRETNFDELRHEFSQTRSKTLELAGKLVNVADTKVLHNTWGKLSMRGWLRYLNAHANLHAQRIS
jgi:hypothetical protein